MANKMDTREVLSEILTPSTQGGPTTPYYPMGDKEGYSLAVCAIPSPKLREQIQEVTEELQQKFTEIHYPPEDYLHMSVAHLGIVATIQEVESAPAEFEEGILEVTNTTPPIKIYVEGINNFDKCFFAEAFNGGHFSEIDYLARLHMRIAKLARGADRQPLYVPHFTMGYPTGPTHKLYAYINKHYSDWVFGEDVIDSLHLTALDTKVSLDQKPFKILAEYPLKG